MDDLSDGVLFLDGFDEALIGVGRIFNRHIAVYDEEGCIEILAREMSVEEAHEYFEFNVAGAYVGEHTPLFLSPKHSYKR